jgi:hypothetical protein
VSDVERELGPIDVLVNKAGVADASMAAIRRSAIWEERREDGAAARSRGRAEKDARGGALNGSDGRQPRQDDRAGAGNASAST